MFLASTYVSLDHLTALGSDSGDEAKHVHLPLCVHHVQHGIDHNEGACSPHARTDKTHVVSSMAQTQRFPKRSM